MRAAPFQRRTLGLLALAVVSACARSGIVPAGEAGGHCYGNGTCNAGLACEKGFCQAPPGAELICQNVQCAGHGTCAVVDGQATCNCAAGYFAAGLTCLACSGSPCPPKPNVMFATSTLQAPGSLGGRAGADALCAQRAQAAGLAGNFVAWLATSTTNAPDRLSGARGWVRTDGRPFVDTIADLVNGKIFWPPRFDEFGNDLGTLGDRVATGTDVDGTVAADAGGNLNCSDFTDTSAGTAEVGFASETTVYFTHSTTSPCSTAMHLYCFEIDHSVPVAPKPVVGRKAFVTSAYFYPGLVTGGVAVADAFCNTDASQAGIEGNFRALLATTTFTAASRFDLSGTPWVRLDGVPLAQTAASFMAGQLEAPLNLTPQGQYIDDRAYTGGDPKALATSPGNTCDDWTSSATTAVCGYPIATNGEGFFTAAGWTVGCQAGARLYCLEP